MPTVTLNQRIIRPLLLFGFALSFVIFYLYVAYRPPIALYADLFEAETKESKALLHNEIGNKYVKFKQLQGAGLNNQVIWDNSVCRNACADFSRLKKSCCTTI